MFLSQRKKHKATMMEDKETPTTHVPTTYDVIAPGGRLSKNIAYALLFLEKEAAKLNTMLVADRLLAHNLASEWDEYISKEEGCIMHVVQWVRKYINDVRRDGETVSVADLLNSDDEELLERFSEFCAMQRRNMLTRLQQQGRI